MDALDVVMKQELQAKACYENLAAETELAEMRTILLGLAAEEDRHIDLLRDLKARYRFRLPESDLVHQAQNALPRLLELKDQVARLEETVEGYRFGMKVEAEGIRSYEDMAQREKNAESAQLFLRLAAIKRQHFNILENLAEFVMRPRSFRQWQEFKNLHEL